MDGDAILTRVGNAMELVDVDLFVDTHSRLAAKFRSQGLTGAALDDKIVESLPLALASALYGVTWH